MLRIVTTFAFLLGSAVFLQAKPVESYRPWFYQEPIQEPAQKAVRKIKDKKVAWPPKRAKVVQRASKGLRRAKPVKLVALPPQAPQPKEEAKDLGSPAPAPELPPVLRGSFDPFGNIIDGFKRFLERTSQLIQGHTMTIQGIETSLGWLHPDFREKLAKAIFQAKSEGYDRIGVFSAYRKPNLGIGGFGDKSLSCHAYGLAVDMAGIGRPCSKEAKRWHEIARAHGVYGPYGHCNGAEWNHMQMVPQKVCGAFAFIRKTITGTGPKDTTVMWKAGSQLAKAGTRPASPLKKKVQVAVRH